MNREGIRKGRVIIRVGKHHLSFSGIDMTQSENPIIYEPYVMKSGVSVSANMREALKVLVPPQGGGIGRRAQEGGMEGPAQGGGMEGPPQGGGIGRRAQGGGMGRRALVMVDAPVLLTPMELFEESKAEETYHHAFPSLVPETVLHNVQPDLNAVAVFAISKDLNTVLHDAFTDINFMTILSPVWRHLHQRAFTGVRNKLYGYFHDNKLDIFSFQHNRFKFYNQFDTNRVHDGLYFLLYVWQQLAFNAEQDELYIVGSIPEREWLTEELKKYLAKAYVINPAADFNRAPATQIKNMPYDLMVFFSKKS